MSLYDQEIFAPGLLKARDTVSQRVYQPVGITDTLHSVDDTHQLCFMVRTSCAYSFNGHLLQYVLHTYPL